MISSICIKRTNLFLQGFCLHPLVSSSHYSSNWWLKSPFDGIRNKFKDLDHSHQKFVLIILILILLIMSICLITISIRQFSSNRFSSRTKSQHNNVEYIMLQNLDDDEINNEHLSNETTIPIKHVEQS